MMILRHHRGSSPVAAGARPPPALPAAVRSPPVVPRRAQPAEVDLVPLHRPARAAASEGAIAAEVLRAEDASGRAAGRDAPA